MAEPLPNPRLSSASLSILVVWAVQCILLPVGLLTATPKVPSRPAEAAPALAAPSSLIPVTAAITLASAAAGIAYALRVGVAWRLLQVGLLAGWFLGGYYSNRVVFVGEAVLAIYLCLALHAREVREEFGIHAAPREIGVLLVLLGLCALLAILRPEFVAKKNFLDMLKQHATIGVMAVGMTMVIVLGGIDLSIGSIVALAGCLATMAFCVGPIVVVAITTKVLLGLLGVLGALAIVLLGIAANARLRGGRSAAEKALWTTPPRVARIVASEIAVFGFLILAAWLVGMDLGVAILVSLGVGLLIGAFNGGLTSCLRINPFIITLGTMSMARSLANVITSGSAVVPDPARAERLASIATLDTLGVPNPVWLMAIVVVLGHVFLSRTRTGRHIYYIGANAEAARLSGVNVVAIKWLVYALCGLLAGLAAIISAARVNATGQPTAGTGDELRVIAAVIIGGATFTGGEGTVLGALAGTVILGVLSQGLVLLEVASYWQDCVQGAVIIGAVAVDVLRHRIRR